MMRFLSDADVKRLLQRSGGVDLLQLQAFVKQLRDRVARLTGQGDLSPREVQEALWLLQAATGGAPPPAPEPAPEEPDARPVAPPPREDPEEDAPEEDERPLDDPSPVGDLELPAEQLSVRTPTPAGAPARRAWRRALRHLALERPSRQHLRVDVRATVQRTAAAGVDLLVQAPSKRPDTVLILLVDEASQLAPWEDLFEAVGVLARQTGRLVDIRQLRVDTRQPGSATLYHQEHPTWLRDHLRPGRRHLVLLFSDGLGEAFTGGALGALLKTLPPRSRVAWLHPWEPETWHQTRYRALPFGQEGEIGPGARSALPVTVVPCTPDGLTALQGWVRGRGAGAHPTVMLPVLADGTAPPARRRPMDLSRRMASLMASLPPEGIEALALAAAVPGGVDLDLLKELTARFGTFGAPPSPQVLAQVISSGLFQRAASGARLSEELRLRFRSDEEQRAAIGPLPRTYVELVQATLLDLLDNDQGRRRAQALGIPLELIRAAARGAALDDPRVRLDGRSPYAALLLDFLRRAGSPMAEAVRRALPASSVKEAELRSPRMHLAVAQALAPLRRQLEKDLLERARDLGVHASVHHAWEGERAARRTGLTFEVWRREFCAQVSAAWVLSLVFVRVLEERGLLRQRRVGPGSKDSVRAFLDLAPYLNERDYLLTVFKELAGLPGTGALFDARHNLACRLAPSAAGARLLLESFQQEGSLPELATADTRALGDLYQHISEEARERYALLQTPDFIADFILDQTLDPAIRTFGLEKVNVIDPTCGSGHFLIDAFHRLYKAWSDARPTERPDLLALRAAAQIAGVDINPFAVAIARFRLTLEFLTLSGVSSLERLPELPFRLAVGDSLLHGAVGEQGRLSAKLDPEQQRAWGDDLFVLEEGEEADRILGERYAAVVGNPPYIAVQDPEKREAYRRIYKSAAGKFTLSAPFTERFFQLAREDGFVGLINANAFTKRDFGKVLIEKVLPQWELTKIVDTSGAYIPGHGTPTLLMFGRRREPGDALVVAVLGKRGEREEPKDPANAPVWSEIRDHHGDIGYEGRHVSVKAVDSEVFRKSPWILTGGDAEKVLDALSAVSGKTLEDVVDSIGIIAFTLLDDAYVARRAEMKRWGIEESYRRPFVTGEHIRDWELSSNEEAIFPYEETLSPISQDSGVAEQLLRRMWPFRSNLSASKMFNGQDKVATGLRWYEYGRLTTSKLKDFRAIPYAFVSTHNNFVMTDDMAVFNRHAPLIKLPSSADKPTYRTLLAYLNSSTVGFWCRQVMFLKGGDIVGDGARVSPAPWDRHLEYSSNLLQQLPLPDLELAMRRLEGLAEFMESMVYEYRDQAPEEVLRQALRVPHAENLKGMWAAARGHREEFRGRMVSIQEEIDWRVYGLFGLPTVVHEHDHDVLKVVRPEHRPMEVRLARDVNSDLSAKLWFERHNRPIPTDVGGPLAEVYARRLRLVDSNPMLQLLETPEAKRRWSPPDDDAAWNEALVSALLDRVEELLKAESRPLTARQLALELRRDRAALALAEVRWGPSVDLVSELSRLVVDQGVPYLSSLRYTEGGLVKRVAWENTWEAQAEQDQGKRPAKERLEPPPTYAPKDYKAHYWRLRGSLDVPRERFILYPDAGPEGDSTPMVGLAGWDALERARALVQLYQERRSQDAWAAERLRPLLAGVQEQIFWLKLWHNAPDPTYGGARQGDAFGEFLAGEARGFGWTLEDLEKFRLTAVATRKGRAGPDLAALTAALQRAQGDQGATPDELAGALGTSKATVTKLLKEGLEAGALVQLSKRPALYASERPAPKGPVRILHLANLQFKDSDRWETSPLHEGLFKDIADRRAEGLGPDLIAITGDLAFSGNPAEYARVEAWLRTRLLPAAGLGAQDVLVVPGNHDVDRHRRLGADIEALEDLEGAFRTAGQAQLAEMRRDNALVEKVLSRYYGYLAFLQQVGVAHAPTTGWSLARTLRGVRVHLAGLDTAWLSIGEDPPNSLVVGMEQLRAALRDAEQADVVVALAHHSSRNLVGWDREAVLPALQAQVDVLLRGHLVDANVARLLSPDGRTVEVVAGGLGETSAWESGYQIVELDPGAGEVRVHQRLWSGASGTWTAGKSRGVTRLPLAARRRATQAQAPG